MSEKPTLPDAQIEFPEETVTWFNSWRDSPRTDGWDAAQWQYMYDTALVHAAVWGSGDFGMIGELRARLNSMGLTFEPTKQQDSKKGEVTKLELIKRRSQQPAKTRASNG